MPIEYRDALIWPGAVTQVDGYRYTILEGIFTVQTSFTTGV